MSSLACSQSCVPDPDSLGAVASHQLAALLLLFLLGINVHGVRAFGLGLKLRHLADLALEAGSCE